MDLVEEFRKALDGNSDVDPFDFKTLIPHDADDQTLHLIFDKLPNNTLIIARVKELLRENEVGGAYVIPDKSNRISRQRALAAAERFANSLKEMLRVHGKLEESSDIDVVAPRIIDSNEEFLKLAGNPELGISEAYEELRLIVRTELKKITKGNFALNEALLGLTNYPQISHYIVGPAINIELDSRAYYELWRGGGDVAFLKKKILLLSPE